MQMVVQLCRHDRVAGRKMAEADQQQQTGSAVREAFDRYMPMRPGEDMSDIDVEVRRVGDAR